MAASGPCRLFTVAAGATTASMFANPPPTLASVPLKPSVAPKPVKATLRAVVYADRSSVSTPAPPSTLPVSVPPSANTKLSAPAVPVTFAKLLNVYPSTVPLSNPPMFHTLPLLSVPPPAPTSVRKPL